MDKILTIIIPTYNMSEYLDTCLKSLIIKSNLLEVLIINDGSKDNSLDIAKKYEKKYQGKELEFKLKQAMYQKGFSISE